MPIKFKISADGKTWNDMVALIDGEIRFNGLDAMMEYCVKIYRDNEKTIRLVLNEVGETCFHMAKDKVEFLSMFTPPGYYLGGWHISEFGSDIELTIGLEFDNIEVLNEIFKP